MYRIAKIFRFEAAHSLPDLPPDHQCARVHGHSYTITVAAVGSDPLIAPGFVLDFADLKPLGQFLADTFDHRNLNEVLDVPATSENLARFLYDWCSANLGMPDGSRVESVRVSETHSTFAEYVPAAS